MYSYIFIAFYQFVSPPYSIFNYDLDDYIKQRLYLTKEEINSIFASEEPVKEGTEGQFNLLSYV